MPLFYGLFPDSLLSEKKHYRQNLKGHRYWVALLSSTRWGLVWKKSREPWVDLCADQSGKGLGKPIAGNQSFGAYHHFMLFKAELAYRKDLIVMTNESSSRWINTNPTLYSGQKCLLLVWGVWKEAVLSLQVIIVTVLVYYFHFSTFYSNPFYSPIKFYKTVFTALSKYWSACL